MGAQRIWLRSDRAIGRSCPALIVAEIGQNHNGNPALACELIDAAAWAGADAVKLVKRDLSEDLCREARQRPYCTSHAFGPTYGQHRRALELSYEDHAALSGRIREHGLVYIGTACDIPSAALFDSLDVDAFKIASRDLSNLPLVADVVRRGRAVLLSTGMSDLNEIDAAFELVASHTSDFLLLQCTSLYPPPRDQVHLRSLPTLADRYDCLVGYSHHGDDILLPPVAVGLGASLIEVHLTLDRQLKGTDHACSLQPEELRTLVTHVREVEQALGRADKPVAKGVATVRAKLGRSLVTRRELRAGTQVEESMLTLKCPGDGLTWQERRRVVGRRLIRDLAADEKLSIDDFIA